MSLPKEHSVWRTGAQIGDGLLAMKVQREPLPTPGRGQYLVRIHAVSLNMRDVMVAEGTYPAPGLKGGVVPCGDNAGEIVAAGPEARKFSVGDKVTAHYHEGHLYGLVPDVDTGEPQMLGTPLDGCLQEYRVFNEISLIRAPDYLTYEELSTFCGAGATAWNALFGLRPPLPSETVLLQGTGGVSMFGLLLAKAAGARTIITSSSEEKLALAKKLGATYTVNYKATPDWDVEVKKLTRGVGAHHIFDNVGPNEIEKCFGSVAPGGIITSIGFLGGEPKNVPDIPKLVKFKQAILRGVICGSKQQFEELLKVAEVHEIHPHIHRVFSFEQAIEAFQYLGSGQHFGKVVIRVSSD